MKKTIAALILAAVAASPAMAKTNPHRVMTEQSYGSLAAVNTTGPIVVEYGMVVGQDPDPAIRLELQRDPTLLAGQ